MSALGVIVNPLSGQDVRRLGGTLGTQSVQDKVRLVGQVLEVAGRLGVERVCLCPDAYGVAQAVAGLRTGLEVEILPIPVTGTARDTQTATQVLSERVALLVVIGGDGTQRQVAKAAPKIPILPLPGGTNNAFAHRVGGTHAGIVAGLVASGRLDSAQVSYRSKVVRVGYGAGQDLALVDAVFTTAPHIGAKALLDPAQLAWALLSFCEPWSLGVASIGAILRPTAREAVEGLLLEFASPAAAGLQVMAPLVPGQLLPVHVQAFQPWPVGEPLKRFVISGTLALDGEREIELDHQELTLALEWSPLSVIDPEAALRQALSAGLLRNA
jgi:hypothetical protein